MARRRWSAAQMRERLQEQERSGLSLKAFGAAGEISYTTVSWWRAAAGCERAGWAPTQPLRPRAWELRRMRRPSR